MSWNYRVIKEVIPSPLPNGEAETNYEVVEMHYNKDGKPNGYSLNKNVLQADTAEELIETNRRIALAFSKPIIDAKTLQELPATVAEFEHQWRVEQISVTPEFDELYRAILESGMFHNLKTLRSPIADSESILFSCFTLAQPDLSINFERKANQLTFITTFAPDAAFQKEILDVLAYANLSQLPFKAQTLPQVGIVVLLAKDCRDQGMDTIAFVKRIESFFENTDSALYKEYVRHLSLWGKVNNMQKRYSLLREAVLSAE